VFCKQLRITTGLPVLPWQIPVGHINATSAVSPYPGGVVPALDNAVAQRGEDSAPVLFLGDTLIKPTIFIHRAQLNHKLNMEGVPGMKTPGVSPPAEERRTPKRPTNPKPRVSLQPRSGQP
jgi:hypothetical protein